MRGNERIEKKREKKEKIRKIENEESIIWKGYCGDTTVRNIWEKKNE